MRQDDLPAALMAMDVPERRRRSSYPEPFRSRTEGRAKQPLGDAFGLRNFGVNLTTLAPGAVSALHHAHSRQDEFVYVLEGSPTLVTDAGEVELRPGAIAGFRAGGPAHHLVNRGDVPARYLEIGDRSAGDAVTYPRDDLAGTQAADGSWRFTRKDGTPHDAA
ncbi:MULTISPECIES: cupin domain-containing protein [Roseomonadaceae]|uniref:Cupin domain-containing protein n=1 Tax=Falsiroseomonas oleicola TaxID=2801474 RepID=A0ABS6HFY1_9PROT|nr:cupin domain-containing protein [Roseomonas oleicola]MBU8546205.1 cupin domain-containing protein [Roseomonas oleicola]